MPHFEILRAPLGDFLFCSKFIASRHKIASKLLSKLEKVASIDPQVALIYLRLCGGFCKMVHVAQTTPPHLAFGSLESFDSDVRMCFSNCVATDISDVAPIGDILFCGKFPAACRGPAPTEAIGGGWLC